MLSILHRKTTLADCGLLDGFIDRHSHILPDVDDGFRTTDESIEALRMMEIYGVKEVWLTPHIMEDIPNTTESLRQKYTALCEAYNGCIRLHLAAENMIDNLFLERWEHEDLLTQDDRHLLVETSYFNPPLNLTGILSQICAKGYTPVLAHPERYKYMDCDTYKRLKALGVKFQLNLGAIAGGYSEATRRNAEWLLTHSMYDFVGSDIHRLRFYETIVHSPISRKFAEAIKTIPNE